MSLAIKGIIPAMVTPFHKNGEVNEEVLRQLVNHLIDGGVHGLIGIPSMVRRNSVVSLLNIRHERASN